MSESGFKIFRDDELIAITPKNSNQYTDNFLSPNTSYKYEIRATDDLFLDKNQRLIADEFISVYENNTKKLQYDYAENIGDGRGITAGRAGFTSATGDMLMVIKRYTNRYPNNSLAKYIPQLKRLEKLRYEDGDKEASASTKHLGGLIKAWKENAKKGSFKEVQDQLVDELYYYPALKIAQKIGAKTALTILAVYDSSIMHGIEGDDGVDAMIKMVQTPTPKDGGDEKEWLREFLDIRLKVMKNNEYWRTSTNRVIELQRDLDTLKNYDLSPMQIYDYDENLINLP